MIQRIHNFLRFFFWFEYLHCRWRINYTWRGFYLANIDVMCVCVCYLASKERKKRRDCWWRANSCEIFNATESCHFVNNKLTSYRSTRHVKSRFL